MTLFEKAMQFAAKWEWGSHSDGGYTNDPTDPGGETKYGISKRGHPNEDIANMTLERALELYKQDYWDFYKLYNFPSPLCIAMFDSFVQHNPKRVAEWVPKDYSQWKAFIDRRRLFYLRIIEKNPSQIKYKKGWLNRLNDLEKLCTIEEQNAT